MPTYLIADGSEIKPEWVEGVDVVGITAGASAPEVMVMDAIEACASSAPVEKFRLCPAREENMEFRVPVELLDVETGKQNR